MDNTCSQHKSNQRRPVAASTAELKCVVGGIPIMIEILDAERIGDGDGDDWVGANVRMFAADSTGEQSQSSRIVFMETRPE